MEKEVKLSEEAKTRALQLMQQRNMADQALQIYLQGCKDALGLEGDWNLDTKTMTFKKVPAVEKKPD